MSSKQTTQEQIANLNNLGMNEMAVIETSYGIITVQKIWHGAEAWLKSGLVPAGEIGVRCVTPREAFNHQLTLGKQYTDAASQASLSDELVQESALRAQFSVVSYALAFAASIRFAARLYQIQIVARNFDSTLFSTNTNGALHTQTFYYPGDSEQIFGACDCLRFRSTKTVCEHLSYIALTELFASVFESTGEGIAA